jgi:hypothetical protein
MGRDPLNRIRVNRKLEETFLHPCAPSTSPPREVALCYPHPTATELLTDSDEVLNMRRFRQDFLQLNVRVMKSFDTNSEIQVRGVISSMQRYYRRLFLLFNITYTATCFGRTTSFK